VARFRIEDPEIDIEGLEVRVMAAIERKRGSRFTDEDLEKLRRTPIEPPLRREDLPHGLVPELSRVRGRLPDVPPPPGPEPAAISATRESDVPRGHGELPKFRSTLFSSGRGGARGRLVGWMRRAMRPFYKATLNLEQAFDDVAEALRRRDDRADQVLDYTERRLEHSLDLLKENLDQRIDRTADWAGGHLSSMTGQIEQRQERQLHLLHNLVYELTNARLDLMHMQDRLNEASRRIARLEARERTLEALTLKAADE